MIIQALVLCTHDLHACSVYFRVPAESRGTGLGIRGDRKSLEPKLSHVNAHSRVRGVWCLLKLVLDPLVTLVFRYGRNTASKDDGQSKVTVVQILAQSPRPRRNHI